MTVAFLAAVFFSIWYNIRMRNTRGKNYAVVADSVSYAEARDCLLKRGRVYIKQQFSR